MEINYFTTWELKFIVKTKSKKWAINCFKTVNTGNLSNVQQEVVLYRWTIVAGKCLLYLILG